MLVVLAGAGASYAVDQKAYPTTIDFFQKLPAEIKSNPLFESVVEFLTNDATRTLNANSPSSKLDIELVLWEIMRMRDWLRVVRSQENLPGYLFHGDRLIRKTNWFNPQFAALPEFASQLEQRISELISKINQQVYSLYATEPHISQLNLTWSPLLRALIGSGRTVDIFTTNYDVVIESALVRLEGAKVKLPQTGVNGSVYRKLDVSTWKVVPRGVGAIYESEAGLVTKLHGSINWSLVNEDIYISDPAFKGDHQRHPIIYPGFKGAPERSPFREFHQYFRSALGRAKVLLVIGFAFRDEYINEMLSSGLNPDADVILIDPSASVSFPLDRPTSRMHRIAKSFDIESIREAVEIIAEWEPKVRQGLP